MKYLFTDFYLEFECIGDKCMDNCCRAGWNIYVDDKTYNLYSALPEPKRSWICNNIVEHNQGRRFVMDEDGKCPFLNENNLCRIFIEVSPDAMSDICKTYPRKMLEYYDVMMCTVTVSCPEVARMLLNRKQPISFEYIEDENIEEVEGADWRLYNELINGLILSTNIFQNRSFDFWKRVYVVIELANTIQKHIESKELNSIREKIDVYKDDNYLSNVLSALLEKDIITGDRHVFVQSLFRQVIRILRQSLLSTDFLEQFTDDIEGLTNETYKMWLDEFRNIEVNTEFENLAVEFIFEYYMEALKGGSLLTNIIKMCLLLLAIRTCEIIIYHKKGELTENDKVLIVSKVSRAMEHTPMLDIIAKEMLKNNASDIYYQLAILLY